MTTPQHNTEDKIDAMAKRLISNIPEMGIGEAVDELKAAIQQLLREAKIQELKRPYQMNIELFSSAQFKAGFNDALDQIDAADQLRIEELTEVALQSNKGDKV